MGGSNGNKWSRKLDGGWVLRFVIYQQGLVGISGWIHFVCFFLLSAVEYIDLVHDNYVVANPIPSRALDFLYVDYKPPRPLEILISPNMLSKYQRMFAFILRLLRGVCLSARSKGHRALLFLAIGQRSEDGRGIVH